MLWDNSEIDNIRSEPDGVLVDMEVEWNLDGLLLIGDEVDVASKVSGLIHLEADLENGLFSVGSDFEVPGVLAFVDVACLEGVGDYGA